MTNCTNIVFIPKLSQKKQSHPSHLSPASVYALIPLPTTNFVRSCISASLNLSFITTFSASFFFLLLFLSPSCFPSIPPRLTFSPLPSTAAMAPAVTLDNVSDFNPTINSSKADVSSSRTLLLAPPSIASHEEKLRNVLAAYDRTVTDLQMLDRLSAGLVLLPTATYDQILILTDANGTRTESTQLLGREVFGKIVQALKSGGKLQSQDGTFARDNSGPERTEAILAGLIDSPSGGMAKPDYSSSEAIPLRFGRKKDAAVSNTSPAVSTAAVPLNGKRKSVDISDNKDKPAGVGFVDFGDDFDEPIITGEDDDDELIDEDTLLTEADLARPVNIRMFFYPAFRTFSADLYPSPRVRS
jgi:hypothetical protein